MFHLPRPFDALPPPNGCIAAYQRFTLPRRERVIVSDRTPRRNTTLVLDTAQGIPVGANTTTGFDTSRDTPCASGPDQRSTGAQESPTQRSIRSESRAITSRRRLPYMITALRVTATAVVTPCADRKSTRLNSSH